MSLMEDGNYLVLNLEYMMSVIKMGNYKEAGSIPSRASELSYQLKDKTGHFVFDTLWDMFYKWNVLLHKIKFIDKEKGEFIIHFLDELNDLKNVIEEKNNEKLFEILINLNYSITDQQHSMAAQRNLIQKDA